jgi:4-hydroxy-tetrahydrodipicolinate reductase
MAKTGTYQPEVTEVHHIHKMDAPSGTALRLAEDILEAYPGLDKWVNHETTDPNTLSIISERTGEVPGTHHVVYNSDVDRISLSHEAKSRKGFALGAVLAAEFTENRTGVFTMHDMLKTLGI